MKNYNRIVFAIITIATLLFLPISAYTDVINQVKDNANHGEHLTINSGFMFPDATSEMTEQWEFILDDGQGSGNCTLLKKPAGTIIADGNWVYTYQGAKALAPFTEAPVTISGKSILITATGTATSPSSPPGYNTSPYTLTISGTAFNGQGSGTFTISKP